MSENSLISIRNGAIASAIAGIFLLFVPALRRHLVSFLSWLWSVAHWCCKALFSSYALPGWAWLIIFVFAAIGLINIIITFRGQSEKPEHASYVEDFIFGAKWRWGWENDRIIKLWCYCPACDATLVYE